MWPLYVWLAGMLIGIFLVVPYFKARAGEYEYTRQEEISLFGIMGSIIWPITLVLLFAFKTIYMPGLWVFERSIKMFIPKPPEPVRLPKVDETKATYRDIRFLSQEDEDRLERLAPQWDREDDERAKQTRSAGPG